MEEKITNIKQHQIKDVKKCILINLSNNECENIVDNVASILNVGYKMILVNNINLTDKKYIEILKKIRQLCSIFNTILIIQNRADIAHIIDSDGLALDNEAINLKYAKDIFSKDKLYAKYIDEPGNDINDFDFIISSNLKISNDKKIILIEEK